MYVSSKLGVPKGHKNFEFVDVYLDSDNCLFIDPCLLELSSSNWSITATHCMSIFFDELFHAYRVGNDKRVRNLLSHAGEINAAKLGYGNGFNGKGRTAEGLYDCLTPLFSIVNKIKTFSKIQDIPVFVENIAEDNISDLLLNILYKHFNDFTLSQLKKYGIASNVTTSNWAFNPQTREWSVIKTNGISYKGNEMLLVPKNIVRKNSLISTDQYIKRIIIERMRTDGSVSTGISKKKYVEDLDDPYEFALSYTHYEPDALDEYHRRQPQFYAERNYGMSDDELDVAIYVMQNAS